jgi:hypothetical protein
MRVYPCRACGRPVPSGKGRSLCPLCRVRASRGVLLIGEHCAVCGTSDLRVLRRITLTDGPRVVCANDATIAGRRELSLAELTAERFPGGDRRSADRRAKDRRTPVDRRAPRGKGALDERRESNRRATR